MDFEWYQMNDLKRRSFSRTTWVPLWSYTYVVKNGRYGQLGYEEEYFGAVSIMFPKDTQEKALLLDWMNVANRHSHNPWIETDGKYYSANHFDTFRADGLIGRYLLLIEEFETGNTDIWYLDQDLLLGLNLLRKGDDWICPREDDLVVARLFRSQDGKPIRLEIRSEHLRDFLCANDSGLLIARYHQRTRIHEPSPELDEAEEQIEEQLQFGKWRRDVRDIHEGTGMEYGAKIAVIQSGHKDIEADEDIPVLPHPTEANLKGKSYTVTRKERRLKHIIADYWQNDWVDPSELSPRIRGDRLPSSVTFVVNNKGTSMNSDDLKDEGRWLWFSPTVINELLSKPYGYIEWHSRELGSVGRSKCHKVTFGVNDSGLVVVYAKDIALLPELDKRIWTSHNISPEGGIGKELHTTQVKGLYVDSHAPEFLIKLEVERLQQGFHNVFNCELFTHHRLVEEFDKRIHRFKAISQEGIYTLCKEVTRLIIERFDLTVLKKLRPSVNNEFKSMKRLELLLNEPGVDGRAIMAPLAGIYVLRHADSHLPSTDVEEAMKLIGIDRIEIPINAGAALIWNAAKSLFQISDAIAKLKKE